MRAAERPVMPGWEKSATGTAGITEATGSTTNAEELIGRGTRTLGVPNRLLLQKQVSPRGVYPVYAGS
jgi:hypothetical protein